MAKPRMTGFVSYARADAPLVDDFLKRMRLRCTTLRDLDVGDWSDDRIMAGQGWAEEIAGAVEFSDFGLLCVTHAFLASEFVRAVELPALRAHDIVIPVMLEPIDIALTDLRGLEDLQLFHHRLPGTRDRKAFSELAGTNRGRFCDELVAQIVARLTTAHSR